MLRRIVRSAVVLTVLPALLFAQVQQQSTSPAPPAPLTADAVSRAQLEGQTAAMTVGTGGWFGGSLVSGVFLGLIGTGVSWGIAAGSNVEMPPEKKLGITSQDPSYRAFAEKAYQDKVRGKRKGAALKGGLLGTAAFVLLVAASSGG